MIHRNFEKIKNSHSGETAFVCGLGPSLSNNIDYIKNNRNEIVFISCNDIDVVTNLSPDYWVWANSLTTAIHTLERFKKNPNSTIVHADSVDPTPNWWIDGNFKDVNYIGYDQRHFNNSKCKNCPNGCSNFIEGRLTIQEELQKYTNYKEKYSSGDTVAVHMLALSILMGCKKIFITGVDLDYKKGYYNSYRPPIMATEFDPYLKNILNDFEIINESAKNIGVEIINLSNYSHLTSIFKTETI